MMMVWLMNRWIPESPRFLLANGREAEARAVMARYGAAIVEEPSELAVEQGVKSRWKELFDRRLKRAHANPRRRPRRPAAGRRNRAVKRADEPDHD
jgi:hypothetical protein